MSRTAANGREEKQKAVVVSWQFRRGVVELQSPIQGGWGYSENRRTQHESVAVGEGPGGPESADLSGVAGPCRPDAVAASRGPEVLRRTRGHHRALPDERRVGFRLPRGAADLRRAGGR